MQELSVIGLILHASLPVQLVMLLLVLAAVVILPTLDPRNTIPLPEHEMARMNNNLRALQAALHVHRDQLDADVIAGLMSDRHGPPPVLLVTVIMPKGMRWPCSLSTAICSAVRPWGAL